MGATNTKKERINKSYKWHKKVCSGLMYYLAHGDDIIQFQRLNGRIADIKFYEENLVCFTLLNRENDYFWYLRNNDGEFDNIKYNIKQLKEITMWVVNDIPQDKINHFYVYYPF